MAQTCHLQSWTLETLCGSVGADGGGGLGRVQAGAREHLTLQDSGGVGGGPQVRWPAPGRKAGEQEAGAGAGRGSWMTDGTGPAAPKAPPGLLRFPAHPPYFGQMETSPGSHPSPAAWREERGQGVVVRMAAPEHQAVLLSHYCAPGAPGISQPRGHLPRCPFLSFQRD